MRQAEVVGCPFLWKTNSHRVGLAKLSASDSRILSFAPSVTPLGYYISFTKDFVESGYHELV